VEYIQPSDRVALIAPRETHPAVGFGVSDLATCHASDAQNQRLLNRHVACIERLDSKAGC
jgi:hypothetical protein